MPSLTVSPARRVVVAMKAESTYGTDIFAGTYTTGDVIPAQGIQPNLSLDEIENLATAGDMGRGPSMIGQERASVRFTMPVRGKGAAYSTSAKPEVDMPLRACGYSSTFSGTAGAEIVTYQPVAQASHEAFSVYIVQSNGLSIQMAGCQGTVEFASGAGGPLLATFTLSGILDAVADISYVAGTLATTPQYPVSKSVAFQIGTENYAARFAQMGFALGNGLVFVPSFNAAGGIAGVFISDRNPRLTIDPEENTAAAFDWFAKWKAGTLNDCSFTIGSVLYNKIAFSFNAAAAAGLQIVNRQHTTRDGLVAVGTTLLATISSGNDDHKIVFS